MDCLIFFLEYYILFDKLQIKNLRHQKTLNFQVQMPLSIKSATIKSNSFTNSKKNSRQFNNNYQFTLLTNHLKQNLNILISLSAYHKSSLSRLPTEKNIIDCLKLKFSKERLFMNQEVLITTRALSANKQSYFAFFYLFRFIHFKITSVKKLNNGQQLEESTFPYKTIFFCFFFVYLLILQVDWLKQFFSLSKSKKKLFAAMYLHFIRHIF